MTCKMFRHSFVSKLVMGSKCMSAKIEKLLRDALRAKRLCVATAEVVKHRGLFFTVQDVLEEAGMSRRDFYDVFVSLDDLMCRMYRAGVCDRGATAPNLGSASFGLPPDFRSYIHESVRSVSSIFDANMFTEAGVLEWFGKGGGHDVEACKLMAGRVRKNGRPS